MKYKRINDLLYKELQAQGLNYTQIEQFGKAVPLVFVLMTRMG